MVVYHTERRTSPQRSNQPTAKSLTLHHHTVRFGLSFAAADVDGGGATKTAASAGAAAGTADGGAASDAAPPVSAI